MLALRRSLGERILETAAHTRLRKRSIHAQNPIRGAAAAQVQINDDYLVQSIKQLKTENTNRNAPPIQQKFKSPPSPIQKKSSQQTNPSSKKESKSTPIEKSAKSKEAKLSTATEIKSPHIWNSENILSLYTEPLEKLLPPEVEIFSRKKSQTYEWRKNPLRFLEEGLKLILNFEYVSLEKTKLGKGIRVRIRANWGKHVAIAIGDGPSKVTTLYA